MTVTNPDSFAGPFRLDGKHALVTGGASGIGQATCRELVSAGAHVYVADLNLSGAQALAAELVNAETLQMDVTQPESIAAAFQQIPHLDILVNNAGIGHVGDILRTELEDFSRLLDVNAKSMFLVTKAAFPLLLASHGSIVNIGSVAGMVGVRHRLAYCASKGAVIAMTRQIAVDTRKSSASTASVPVRSILRSWRAISTNTTRTKKKRCAPRSRPGSPSAALARLRRSHRWFAICVGRSRVLTEQPCQSTADGRRPKSHQASLVRELDLIGVSVLPGICGRQLDMQAIVFLREGKCICRPK